jgi:pyridoxine 4-dehydrogenase
MGMNRKSVGEGHTERPAAKTGEFKIGGDLRANRLGFGAMRITGKGI